MKIGLMTYFSVDNTGQFYQAKAALQALRETYPGSTIELINIRHERRPTWLPPRSLKDAVPYLVRHFRYNRARSRNFGEFLGKTAFQRPSGAEITNYLNESKFDIVITGADTCLKVDKHWGNQLPPYWIPREVKARKFFVSGSAENTVSEDLGTDQIAKARASLNDLSGIYVRDTMTRNLCATLLPERASDIQVIGDPTFTFQLSTNKSRLLKRLAKKGKPLCAVNLPKGAFCSAIIAELSRKYTVFSLNRPGNDGEVALFLGPQDWLEMWNSLDAIVTTSFHETIFAMRSGVPLISMDAYASRAGRMGVRSKAGDLLNQASIGELLWSMPEVSDAPKILSALEDSKLVAGSQPVLDYCEAQAASYWNAVKSVGDR